MKFPKFAVILSTLLFIVGISTIASAATVNFDDFSPVDHGTDLPDGYAGLTWDFFTQPSADPPWTIIHYDGGTNNFPTAQSGNYYLKGTMNGGDEGNRIKINFSDTVGPVSVDSISFRQKIDNNASWPSSFILQANLSDGSVLQDNTISFSHDEWITYTNLFNGASNINALVFIDPTNNGVTERFLIDSLDFTAVPLPAAFWLLGSGLLALLGLRKTKIK